MRRCSVSAGVAEPRASGGHAKGKAAPALAPPAPAPSGELQDKEVVSPGEPRTLATCHMWLHACSNLRPLPRRRYCSA
jgi:hypothetical protein